MLKDEVLQLEKELSFDFFSNEDAYNIALIIVNRIKKDQLKNIRIRAVFDGEIVFQYLMKGKKGDIWLNRKQNTIERFHHSGYYIFLDNEENGTYEQYKDDETIVICGGGFPIIVKDEIVGSFIVSGLDHVEDHQLIVDAFREYKIKKS